jgi:hypothetical protein
MTNKPTLHGTITAFLAALCLLFIFSSCKRDDVSPTTTKSADSVSTNVQVANAGYVWGELAINKKTESDAIKYDAVTGKIDSVMTYDNNGVLISNIGFTYSGNKITLNSPYKDEYDITEIERYGYDANNYLNKVTMSSNFDDYIGPVYSEIDYEVTNGNYTKYTLSNTDSGTVTRQYVFTYNTTKKVNSPCAFFAPIFANNTIANIDKYLNYGKASVNLLTGLSYTIKNLDYTVVTGSYNVVTTVNADNYITSLNLEGNTITGFPSDNISPLPRGLNFTLISPTKY